MSLPDECLVFYLTAREVELLESMRQQEPDPDLWQLRAADVRASSIFRFLEQLGCIYEDLYDTKMCWVDIPAWYFVYVAGAPQLYIPLE